VPIFLKSGNIILLETSGPVQACNGIALPLPLPFLRNYCLSSQTAWSLCLPRRGKFQNARPV